MEFAFCFSGTGNATAHRCYGTNDVETAALNIVIGKKTEGSLYPAYILCREIVVLSASYIAEYIQVHFRLDFIKRANTMIPDQTAPKNQSNLDP